MFFSVFLIRNATMIGPSTTRRKTNKGTQRPSYGGVFRGLQSGYSWRHFLLVTCSSPATIGLDRAYRSSQPSHTLFALSACGPRCIHPFLTVRDTSDSMVEAQNACVCLQEVGSHPSSILSASLLGALMIGCLLLLWLSARCVQILSRLLATDLKGITAGQAAHGTIV